MIDGRLGQWRSPSSEDWLGDASLKADNDGATVDGASHPGRSGLEVFVSPLAWRSGAPQRP